MNKHANEQRELSGRRQQAKVIQLHPRHYDPRVVDQFASSGMEYGDMKLLQIDPVPCNAERLRQFGVEFGREDAEAYLLPYADLDGNVPTIETGPFSKNPTRPLNFRARILNPDVDSSDRYRGPKGQPPAFYLPLNLKKLHVLACGSSSVALRHRRVRNWRQVADDPSIAVFFTEGERKAACACKAGIPTIGLGGVDSFVTKYVREDTGWKVQEESEPLEDFNGFEWGNRSVYVGYDSPQAIDPMHNVNGARGRLANLLLSLGANVFTVDLPNIAPGGKTGLDDFFVQRRVEGCTDDAIVKELFGIARTWQPRPQIEIKAGRVAGEVDKAQAILGSEHREARIYMRGGVIVKIDKAPLDPQPKKLQRSPEAVGFVPATATMIEDRLNRFISWLKYNPRAHALVPTSAPEKHAKILFSRGREAGMPRIHGIIEAPIMLPDGTIACQPGYNEETELWLHSTREWTLPAHKPTRLALRDAICALLSPFQEFPFVSDADRGAFVASILTGLQRRLLSNAPIFCFDAPVQSSGKSLLSDCVALIATGRSPTCQTFLGKDEAEWRKALTTILLFGDPVVQIDNVIGIMRSAVLAKVLTQEFHDDRILGVTSKVQLPTNTLFLLTGNNVKLGGDMPERALRVKIDPRMEDPKSRTFKIADLRRHVIDHRVELVRAALTILKAHHAAGRSRAAKHKPFSKFSQWDEQIRGALLYAAEVGSLPPWARLSDPCSTQDEIKEDDPDRDQHLALLVAWQEVFKNRSVTLAEVKSPGPLIDSAQLTDREKKSRADLRDALNAIAERRGQFSKEFLQYWCRDNRDVIVGGLVLRRDGAGHGNAMKWHVAADK